MVNIERSRPSARDINDTIRYTNWVVFKRTGITPDDAAIAELESVLESFEADDIVVRGFYDVSGMRADADLMVWLHAPTAELVQRAIRDIRRTSISDSVEISWAGMGLHRPAEFNKGHVPAFMAGVDPKDWVVVYPFVRSYEWYLLPEEERRAMLVEHGMMGRDYGGISSNTVSAFALGDYEWILALESNELHETVDMMRHLRSSQARRHVREEIPFYTGRRVTVADAVDLLR